VNYVYYCAGRYKEAIKLCQRTIELEPQNPQVYEDLARNYEQLSKHDEAHKYRLSSLKISGTAAEAISAYDSLYKRFGSKAYPTWLLMNQEKLVGLSIFITPFCYTAWIHTRLGDNDKALSFLEKAYENKEGELATLKIDPKWDSLRDEPKFKDLLKRMRFPD